jgi:hypothetical protein
MTITLDAPAHLAGARPLELPRPWRLIWTAGWNLGESVGLPIAAYLVGGWLGGQDAGMVAATVVMWVAVAVRKIAAHTVPGLLTISALVLTLQTGWWSRPSVAVPYALTLLLALLRIIMPLGGEHTASPSRRAYHSTRPGM